MCPKDQPPVIPSSYELPVVKLDYGSHGSAMADERGRYLLTGAAPEPDLPISPSGGNHRAVRRDGDSEYPILVSRQDLFASPAPNVPDAHSAVSSAGSHSLIIDKRKTANGISLIGQGSNLMP
jgi:hypothetical protein